MESIIGNVSVKDIFSLFFYIISLFLVIHVTIFAYHWYTFGADKHKSLIGIIVYIIGGALILSALALSLWYI